ncbi:A/G-specific adenine glycosylase [Paraflavitalea sp. CAU 1676]|uniref:A/G-specific adenine glycosylase n=1 Tax=Paraflavitalea sp. CAU 1676 TaxID=3032598 RepID=UPI0023DA5136|nr:A/G-specific adenine glycosylase [Paraflavitalea sp. CAU 1676]MDF2193597.1 A/G-specific adenine glycosylase [Paraflavitalea sp. CAU 1676]
MKPIFTEQLLAWNKSKNSRSMPWKGEKDPYKIWLSEIILQQTRVEQGLAYYEKFIKAFPTIQQLAKAPEKKIFKLWEGLGYYTRCRNLMATAQIVVNDYKGKFPATYEEIKKLKGIGPYTAAAISSFAFNEAQAVVDGNVQRVIARYFGISTPIDTTAGKKMYQELATALLDTEQPGVYNQAIMDFGAVICKPQNPLCGECPQQADCEAFKHNLVKQLPVKEKTLAKKDRWFYYFIIQFQDKIYIHQRTGKDIWQDLHEFALYEAETPVQTLFQDLPFLKELFGKQSYSVTHISKVFHQQLTHQHIHGQFITVTTLKPVTALKGYDLVDKKQLKKVAFPRIIKSFLEEKASLAQLF